MGLGGWLDPSRPWVLLSLLSLFVLPTAKIFCFCFTQVFCNFFALDEVSYFSWAAKKPLLVAMNEL
jgi:hypothetical protein